MGQAWHGEAWRDQRDCRDAAAVIWLRPETARCPTPAPSGTPGTRRAPLPASCRRSPVPPVNGASPPSRHGRRSGSRSRGGWQSPDAGRPAGRGLLTSDRRGVPLRGHDPWCRGHAPGHPEAGPVARLTCSPALLDSRHATNGHLSAGDEPMPCSGSVDRRART
jgi:hypothetical protein